MLNISTSQHVSWPTAPPMPATPVQAVPAVGAAQSSSRDTQTDSGRQGQKSPGAGASAPAVGRASSEKTAPGAPAAQPAPLLPRGHKDSESMSVADRAAENRVQTEQRMEEEQKAREKEEQKVQLKEVLASVWKASAAVVEVVLGKESSDRTVAVNDASQVAAAAAVAPTAPASLEATPVKAVAPTPQTQADLPGIEPIPAALRRELEPTAYTEQGAGSWDPVEAGSLISQRV